MSFHTEVRKERNYFAITLAEPEVIRSSRLDPKVFILYRAIQQGKYLAIVIKTNHRNFILTGTNEEQNEYSYSFCPSAVPASFAYRIPYA